MSCLLVLVVLVASVAAGKNATFFEGKLQESLFRDYRKYVIPQPVELEFAVFLKSIGEVDRHKEEIEFDFLGYFEWHDHRLQWDPKAYGNVSHFPVPGEWLWKPDLVAYNGVHDSNFFFMTPKTSLPMGILYHDGKVLYLPPFRTRARCDFEAVSDGAFRCQLYFGSWTASKNHMEITIHDHRDKVDITRYHGKNWQVVDSTLRPVDYYHSCCTESYPYMEVNITLKAIPNP